MSYVKSNLMPNEQIVAEGRTHWWAYMPGFLRIVIGLLLIWWALRPETEQVSKILDLGALLAGGIFSLKGGYLVFKSLINAWTTELVITDKRVIVKWGLVRRGTIELQHAKVESLNVIQGVAGRLLDFGTLVVHGIGGAQQPFHHIAAPLNFRRALYQN